MPWQRRRQQTPREPGYPGSRKDTKRERTSRAVCRARRKRRRRRKKGGRTNGGQKKKPEQRGNPGGKGPRSDREETRRTRTPPRPRRDVAKQEKNKPGPANEEEFHPGAVSTKNRNALWSGRSSNEGRVRWNVGGRSTASDALERVVPNQFLDRNNASRAARNKQNLKIQLLKRA
ncbi:hypothetical protein NDU88_001152 [Pleurodeles waltl]|uniref:Uncharacterized protein n=1 Tax=Pleurodeles waltl TaxID=8319 RepID=A0AAV7MIX8_PLEWA|nr:hypothetical protein NDU88_001152 [Pleurodeles waltl]